MTSPPRLIVSSRRDPSPLIIWLGPPLLRPSTHFRVVLIISRSGVETNSSSALVFRGIFVVSLIAIVTTITLVVVPLIAEMLWKRTVILTGSAALISMVVVIAIVAAADPASNATTTLVVTMATTSSTAASTAHCLRKTMAVVVTVLAVVTVDPLVMGGVLVYFAAIDSIVLLGGFVAFFGYFLGRGLLVELVFMLGLVQGCSS